MFERLLLLDYKYKVVIVYMFGLMMNLLDSTALNVAVPRLQSQFHAPLSTVEWTVTGYLLSLALFVPGAGFISDRFGTKRTFLVAVVLFTAGSALCGLAPGIKALIVLRFLQGVGGGMMTPVGAAMVSREFPGAERVKASAYLTGPVVLAPILGPVLGGWMVQFASWRWIFYINIPVGVMVVVLSVVLLREHREAYAQGSFDVTGLALGGVGTAMALFALSKAASSAWTSTSVLVWGFGGLACLAVFALVELHVRTPILDLTLFKERFFSLGSAMMLGTFAASSGFLFLLTLFLQEFQHRSPLHAGLTQAPSAFGTAVALPLSPFIYQRVGPRRILVAGFGVGALLMIPFMRLDLGSSTGFLVLLIAVRGIPVTFANVALQTLIYGPLPGSRQGAAASIYSTERQVAASFGVALAATVQVSRYNVHLRDALGAAPLSAATRALQDRATALSYHDAFLVIGAMLAFSTVVALFVSDRRVHDAMARRMRPVETAGSDPAVSLSPAAALAGPAED